MNAHPAGADHHQALLNFHVPFMGDGGVRTRSGFVLLSPERDHMETNHEYVNIETQDGNLL